MKLTSKQEQVLNGLLLGDGCLFVGKSNKCPLLTVARAAKDLEYLRFQHGIFRKFCSDEGIIKSDKTDRKANKTYKGFKFRTRAIPELLPYHSLWYPDGKKIVPASLELTPTTMAHWFCDDGSIRTKNDRSGGKYQSLVLKLSTNGFQKHDVEFLHSLLTERYGSHFSIVHDSLAWYKKKHPSYTENNNNFFILTYTEGAWNIFHDIEKVFPPGMERKLNVWKSVDEPTEFHKSTAEISKQRVAQLMSFINSHPSFTVMDIAEGLDWFMFSTRVGKEPNGAIRKHLNKLVENNLIIRSNNKSDRGFIYKVV